MPSYLIKLANNRVILKIVFHVSKQNPKANLQKYNSSKPVILQVLYGSLICQGCFGWSKVNMF
jgi:hypothetical protein